MPEARPPSEPPTTVLGVDVGGTKVSVAALHHGRLGEPRLCPTEHRDGRALVEQLAGMIEQARAEAPGEVAAVGLGIPSVIEWRTGRVRSSVNVALRDVPLRAVLQERVGLPVFVDNDANCAALAEAHDEEGRLVARHLVMVTVGTGVGGGIVVDGSIYRGATGGAAEIGHMIIGLALEDGPPPPAPHPPQPGSLEALASGRALDILGRQAASREPSSELGRIAASGATVAGPAVVRAAHDGDAVAQEAIARLGHRLGIGIANMVNIFDPEVLAIGGGVSGAGDLLLVPAREVALRFILPGVGTETEIRLATAGPRAGVRGAALLAAAELSTEAERR